MPSDKERREFIKHGNRRLKNCKINKTTINIANQRYYKYEESEKSYFKQLDQAIRELKSTQFKK